MGGDNRSLPISFWGFASHANEQFIINADDEDPINLIFIGKNSAPFDVRNVLVHAGWSFNPLTVVGPLGPIECPGSNRYVFFDPVPGTGRVQDFQVYRLADHDPEQIGRGDECQDQFHIRIWESGQVDVDGESFEVSLAQVHHECALAGGSHGGNNCPLFGHKVVEWDLEEKVLDYLRGEDLVADDWQSDLGNTGEDRQWRNVSNDGVATIIEILSPPGFVIIPANGAVVESNVDLLEGIEYEIVIEGVYRYDSGEPGEFADAQYREDDNNRWTIRFNSVELDGVRLTADIFDLENHRYVFHVVGKGQPMTFRIYDSRHSDNDGSLTATIAIPDIEVDPTSLEQTLEPGQTKTETLTINNEGIVDLIWSLSEDPSESWLSATSTSGILAPGASQDIQVTFDSADLAPGAYATSLNVESNDPVDPDLLIPVALTMKPQCTLNLELAYTDDILVMDFDLGLLEPASWGVWLLVQKQIIPLWSYPMPRVDPPLSPSLPIFGFPQLGKIVFITALTASDGVICFDFAMVDTGKASSESSLENLPNLFQSVEGVVPNN